MKLIYYTAVVLFMVACSAPKKFSFERTGEVNAVSHENSIISLSSLARAESVGKASYFAERNAFENLIFKGIPNTNQESPMIPNETEALRKNSTLFKSLLVNQEYKRFIMDSYISNNSNANGVHMVEQIVKIDLKALRNYLQQEGVTKKFGL